MEFSEHETRLIAILRERQRRSRRWRVPSAIFLTSLIVFWLVILNLSLELPIEDFSLKLLFLVFVVPTSFAVICVASFLLGETIRNWRGKPEIDLLLRVIDEMKRNES